MRSRPAFLVAVALALTAAGTAVSSAATKDPGGTGAATVPFQLVSDRDVDDRLPRPEDRYAFAGGCYTLEAPGQGFVSRDGQALALATEAAAATPFHFQPTRLGEYLLATDEGPDTSVEGAWWDVRDYAAAGPGLPVVGALPVDVALPLPGGPVVATEPSVDAEWRVDREGPGYLLTNLGRDAALTAEGGALTLGEGTALVARHVKDDDPTDKDANGSTCATWPEVATNATGDPTPARGGGPSREVEGFFEAHVHGMAYEFLGGELRCGQPWHPYGVEFALGNCRENGQVFNNALEVGLAGEDPSAAVTDYDPVGWPTFAYWPQHDTLTHEQYYWRWLERAYLGGLRLTTNLLVDNTALCQLYPLKKNSCNEMDGVRLQAQRLHELQDYVDAQAGGPGEGWLRIVTSPAQAREVINAGRLAVVMGVEVSVLFDCGEVLDQPQCTADQIDTRLQEVFDLGVRQMELTNKFDNALSGVTGDGGSTGVVVNTGNRYVTGHFWDMDTCADEAHDHGVEGTQHDRQQLNALDDAPGERGEVDVLAGRVLSQFGEATKGYVAPAYPSGPHCNSRGLTDLGEHLVRQMVAKGMVFDPDHMSALAQRQALDLIQDELVPAELAAAGAERRPVRLPAVMSSHSWANDVIYQRIHQLAGAVAPRTGDAATFADRWARNRAWSQELAPDGIEFGMGYGADTNGLGGQPGPRTDPATPLAYTDQGWKAPIGDVTLRQQVSGVHTYDINRDGVAHYGMFADWFRELALAADEKHPELGGGRALITDMLAGSENYLSMWERSVYGGNDCVVDGSMLQFEDVHAALGLNLEGFLSAVGQPVDREGAAYRYCTADEQGHPQVVDVQFDGAGTARDVVPAAAAANGGVVPIGGVSQHGHLHVATASSASALPAALPATGGGAGTLALGGLVLLGVACLTLRLVNDGRVNPSQELR